MKLEATFVRSAAGAEDFPRDGAPEIALVGRSNVGKSTLINALVRQRVARTSAAPGKTRLANIYRVERAPRHTRGALSSSKGGSSPAFYLVDLPGYGYARGGGKSAREFDELTRAFFWREGRERQEGREGKAPAFPAYPARSALLLVDSRHPGLERDVEAWRWLRNTVERSAIVATKIDKLSLSAQKPALAKLKSGGGGAGARAQIIATSGETGAGREALWSRILDACRVH